MLDHDDHVPTTEVPAIVSMSRDIAKAAVTLTDDEARYLVDLYYTQQEYRKSTDNQVRSLYGTQEPNSVLKYFSNQFSTLEKQAARALDKYTQAHPMGEWMRSIHGIGPVIAAGLLAHIDVNRMPTAGSLWRYAGLDPSHKWLGREKSAALIKEHWESSDKDPDYQRGRIEFICQLTSHSVKGYDRYCEVNKLKQGKQSFERWLASRPWNAQLKTLCWKLGESFMKFSGNEKCRYGRLYIERREQYWIKNLSGGFYDRACQEASRVDSSTDVYPWVTGCYLPDDIAKMRAAGISPSGPEMKKIQVQGCEGVRMLSPGHINEMAKRYAVKIFLSHLHAEMYRTVLGKEPPAPFAIAILGHTHEILP